MAPSFTARLGLKKPAGVDNYNIADDNGNMDILDALLPVTICTSVTRPASPFNGQIILETDTGRTWVYITALTAWFNNVLGLRPTLVAAANGTTALFRAELVNSATLAGNRLIDGRLVGAANPGWQVDFDGMIQWGPGGGTTPDVNLYRLAANTLATDDGLVSTHAGMETVYAEGGAATSTVQGALSDTLATGSALTANFTTPPSGKIKITICSSIALSAAGSGSIAQMGARISGSVGTVSSALARTINQAGTTGLVCSRSWVVDGLPALTTGTVTCQYARSLAAGTSVIMDWRSIVVEPCLN